MNLRVIMPSLISFQLYKKENLLLLLVSDHYDANGNTQFILERVPQHFICYHVIEHMHVTGTYRHVHVIEHAHVTSKRHRVVPGIQLCRHANILFVSAEKHAC